MIDKVKISEINYFFDYLDIKEEYPSFRALNQILLNGEPLPSIDDKALIFSNNYFTILKVYYKVLFGMDLTKLSSNKNNYTFLSFPAIKKDHH